MGHIAKVISAERSEANGAKITDIKADPGGEAIATAQLFSQAGDDSLPVGGDYALFVQLPGGSFACVGNIDIKNKQTAKSGDRRFYSRNSDGDQMSEVWLKNDGEVLLGNENGFIKIQPDGTVNINGSTIDKDGKMTVPESFVLKGVELSQHKHAYSWTGVAGSGLTQVEQ